MAVKKTYRINLRNYGSPPAVMVSQYDEGYAIAFEIFDGPLPVLASSLSGYTFKLKGRQPGNPPFLAYEFEGTLATALNAVVSFEIDTTMTGRAGKGTAELVILDEENDVKFASVNFAVYTEPAAVPDGSIDADVQRAMEIAEEVQEIVDTAAETVSQEAEAWAVGQRGGQDVPSTDPAYQNNAKYYAQQAAETVEEISDVTDQVATNTSDISDLKEDLNGIADIVTTYGEPSTTWTVGTLSSNGASLNSYKNTIRTYHIFAHKGSVISIASGYYIRVYRYTKTGDTYTYVDRTDWLTSYTVDSDIYLRLLVSDDAHKDVPSSVLPDTSYSTQVDWSKFILTTIDEQIAPIVANEPYYATGGYLDVTLSLVPNGKITTGTSTGETISLTPTELISYTCGVLSCKKGDVFKLTGAAQGSGNVRLWAFTDGDGKILTLASAFATGTNLVLTAPNDGYFVCNANMASPTLQPKLERYVSDIKSADEIMRSNIDYDNLNSGRDILSAFSNIMCCGDSLTASVVYTGVNGSTNITRPAYRRYPQILASKTGATVEYHALGGYSASDWWNAYNQYIVGKENQLAIVYLGTNGGLTDTIDTDAAGDDVTQYNVTTNTGAYCAIVKSFLDAGAKVLLIHINKRDSDLWVTNEVIDKIAEKFSVATVTVPYLADDKYHLWPDGTGKNTLHYNDFGYAAFTESLIKRVGILSTNMMARLIPD